MKRVLSLLLLTSCAPAPTPTLALTPAPAPAPSPSPSPTPTPAPSPSTLDCTSIAGPRDHATLHIDFPSMTGTVTLDGFAQPPRHLRAKVTPYAGTYLFLFTAYDAADQKPPTEKLVPGTSILARLVTVGDDTLPYFDGDITLHDASGKKLESLAKCTAPAN